MQLPYTLDETQIREMEKVPAEAWFSPIEFENARSPVHPQAQRLDVNHQRKMRLVRDWIESLASGRTVLDTFSANGAFSFLAARAGATSVTSLEFDAGRVEAARLVPSFDPDLPIRFHVDDIYELAPGRLDGMESFEVVLCLGGLYHVPDPAGVLKRLRSVCTHRLILQTSAVLPNRGNVARFQVRRDRAEEGLSSVSGVTGRWRMSSKCIREMLRYAGFEVLEERKPDGLRPRRKPPFLGTFPWRAYLCRPC